MNVHARKQTTLKTIRIPEEMIDILKKDAQLRGISVNSLVNAILTRYTEHDRYSEKLGCVLITRNLFRGMLNKLSEESMHELAEELGRVNPKEASLLQHGSANVQSIVDSMQKLAKYGRTAECEIRNSGSKYTVVFHHDYEDKWSKFLRTYWSVALETIVGVTPAIEISKNAVAFNFSVE